MIKRAISQAACHPSLTSFVQTSRALCEDEAGNSTIEYALVLTLALLGATTLLGGIANGFANLIQYGINTVGGMWPA